MPSSVKEAKIISYSNVYSTENEGNWKVNRKEYHPLIESSTTDIIIENIFLSKCVMAYRKKELERTLNCNQLQSIID